MTEFYLPIIIAFLTGTVFQKAVSLFQNKTFINVFIFDVFEEIQNTFFDIFCKPKSWFNLVVAVIFFFVFGMKNIPKKILTLCESFSIKLLRIMNNNIKDINGIFDSGCLAMNYFSNKNMPLVSRKILCETIPKIVGKLPLLMIVVMTSHCNKIFGMIDCKNTTSAILLILARIAGLFKHRNSV